MINHALGKASFPFLLFPDMISQQLLKEEYDFSIFGFKHDKDDFFKKKLPITQKEPAILLGTYAFIERKEWVLDPDKNGKLVMVNAAGAIALKLKGIDFVDNDGTVYAFTKDDKIFDLKNALILDRLLESNQYLYLRKDGSLITSYERPHTRKRQIDQERDSVRVKIKDGLEWHDAGITAINDDSIEYGQILSAEIISVNGSKGWSLATVNVKVKGLKEKWYTIVQYKSYSATISHGQWPEVRLSLEAVTFNDNQGFTIERFAVYGVFQPNETPKCLGLLPSHCTALTLGVSVRAKVRYSSLTREVLFSPF